MCVVMGRWRRSNTAAIVNLLSLNLGTVWGNSATEKTLTYEQITSSIEHDTDIGNP